MHRYGGIVLREGAAVVVFRNAGQAVIASACDERSIGVVGSECRDRYADA